MDRFSSILFFSLLVLLTAQSYAQWSTDPTNNLIVGYGLLPELASDSAGGCYITYEQNLSYPRHLVLERLNRYGYKPWGSGKQITGLLPEQSFAKIVEDGNNGVIVAYQDIEITGDPKSPQFTELLRVQRLDSSGNFLWGPNGVRVTISDTLQSYQAIVSDGRGGCIVTWVDVMENLRINRIDSIGTRVWGDSGKYVWNSAERPPMISDGNGGCYISYEYQYLQWIDSTGAAIWPNHGKRVPTGIVTMSKDFLENIYLFGGDFIGYNGSVNVWTAELQKVNFNGSFLWDSSGIFIDTIYDGGGLTRICIITAPGGTSFLAWDNTVNAKRKVFGQIVSTNGIPLTISPFMMGSLSSDEWTPQLVISNSQSTIFMWRDYDQNPSRIYAQRINSSGSKMWDTLNITVSIPALSYEKITTDCNAGCIIIGSDENFSIRAQQVSNIGNLGKIITGITDEHLLNIPQRFELHQNYPNPFNPITTIRYDLPSSTWVKLEIFDQLGRVVQVLTNAIQQPGSYEVNFNAENLSSGIYFYRLLTREKIRVRKFIILK